MKDAIVSLFSGNEIQKRQQIAALMSDWKSELSKNVKGNADRDYDPLDYFVSDGFFPGYYNQEIKVLFIGRETRYMEEGDWIQCAIDGYKNKNASNNKGFTRNLLNIAQGIKGNGQIQFEDLKKPNDYAKELSDSNNYGFAYMNISKYSNWKDDGEAADFDFINMFLEDSNLEKRNFFQEELEILDPDIIITMNLWDRNIESKYLDLCFGKIELDINDGLVNLANIVLNNKNVKILNTYHFSYPSSPQEYFYNPVMKVIFEK
jgi:hypothetical protein